MKDKLRVFQTQNDENNQIAQNEINEITIDLERTMEHNKTLENEIRGLKFKLNDLFVKNHELEREAENIQHAKAKANEYAEILEAKQREEH